MNFHKKTRTKLKNSWCPTNSSLEGYTLGCITQYDKRNKQYNTTTYCRQQCPQEKQLKLETNIIMVTNQHSIFLPYFRHLHETKQNKVSYTSLPALIHFPSKKKLTFFWNFSKGCFWSFRFGFYVQKNEEMKSLLVKTTRIPLILNVSPRNSPTFGYLEEGILPMKILSPTCFYLEKGVLPRWLLRNPTNGKSNSHILLTPTSFDANHYLMPIAIFNGTTTLQH